MILRTSGKLAPEIAAVRNAVRDSLADIALGQQVFVACSGGPDSLALAVATAFVGKRYGYQIGAIIVDHQWHSQSAQVAAVAAEKCRNMGLAPVLTKNCGEVAELTDETHGPEGKARAQRYRIFEQVSAEFQGAPILLGHNLNDQAETVLLGLLRGSGAKSLAGMQQISRIYRRPLLNIDRKVIEKVCELHDLQPWIDPANTDPAYTRTKIRHHVLPLLTEKLGAGIISGLITTAQLCRADADYLDAEAKTELQKLAVATENRLEIAVPALVDLPKALRWRVIRLAAIAAGANVAKLHFSHVLAIDSLVTDWHGQQGVAVPGKIKTYRKDGVIRFAAAATSRSN